MRFLLNTLKNHLVLIKMQNKLKPLLLLLITPIFIVSCQKDKINSADIFDAALNQKSDSCQAYLSNAFTPNGDAMNEVLRPFLKGVKSANFELTIRTDNQKIIYTSQNLNASWDGDDCPTGRYIATMKGSFECGSTFEKSIYVCLFTDCVKHDNIQTLEFESMFDPVTGQTIYVSGEKICP